MNSSTDILKIFAAISFGLSAALFSWVIYQLMRSEKGDARAYAGPSMRRAEMRNRSLARTPGYALLLALLRPAAGFFARLDLQSFRDYVRKPYARAGYPGGLDDDEAIALGFYIGLVMMVFLGFTVAVFFGLGMVWIGVFGIPVGFVLMISVLQTRGEQREHRIMAAMPYVLDLLVLILRSGTSLTIALGRVVADYAEHPVGDEFGQVLAEIEMGAPRGEALRRLAERLDNTDITSLADSIAQSEELGWPLADTLERQADRMAAERVLRAQSKAGAAGVIVMLPSTLVLLAAVILMFGPIIVRFMLGGLSIR